ncbi:NCS cytosine-purine permease [Irpex rosettiformis]|uniref:NCS cytosine-purine permease n=1 Tax=Irpex rosettiformis TaxID=378272 RepID=A0ACB8U5X0_9APHY|nr:NCS cytosine-purine permease [Irpex rosettiformis]
MLDLEDSKLPSPSDEVEKETYSVSEQAQDDFHYNLPVMRKLLNWGVEARGILPVPPSQRTDTHYSKIFFIWGSANFNILSFSAGTLGPVVFGLGLRDSCLVILFFNLLCSAVPAYLSTWGPKLGLRQMCQARYSFGYFGVIIPCILNLIGMCGFCILNGILGGQTLSSVSDGNLSWSVGIVIIAVLSLLVSFCGYNVLNWYERLAWIPTLIVYVVALGIGGKHLINPPPAEPANASTILSFASTIAGFVITYAPLGSDFSIYFRPDAPSWRIFLYSYLGFNLPIITVQCLGAAVVIATPTVPAWSAGYENGNVGGLLEAMLHPAGGFGKFLTVLLALSVTANVAPTFYSVCLNFQIFMPFLVPVPRYVFSILVTAIIIPLSIVGATKFYDTLTNFLGLIGYWASAFAAVILVEHFVIRKGRFEAYDLRYWNSPSKLPTGLAALGACILACGVVVPSMDQVWFVGPIARHTGDIGFELAFAATALLYSPLRYLELRFRKLV